MKKAFGVFLFFTLILLPSLTFAQSFSVFPGKSESEIEPGTRKTFFISIKNNLNQDYNFLLEVEDITPSEEGIVFESGNRGPYSLKNYVFLDNDQVLVPNGQTIRVPVTVSMPKSAPVGSRHAAILVSPVLPSAVGKTQISSRIASLLFIRIPGDENLLGRLVDFQAQKKIILGQKSETLTITFQNEGNTYLNAYGLIKLKKVFGEETIVPIDPWFILPGSIRSRDIEINDLSTGIYRANLDLNRGYQNVIDSRGQLFFVLSFNAILTLLAVLILFVLALILIIKLKKK